jgi:hypothetical protein
MQLTFCRLAGIEPDIYPYTNLYCRHRVVYVNELAFRA